MWLTQITQYVMMNLNILGKYSFLARHRVSEKRNPVQCNKDL